jgi:dynein heavy chain
LKEIASKELTFIIRDTLEYQRQLSPDIGNIESLKALLNIITEIKNKSMDMEFRINEVQENFRILKMYKFQVEKDLQDQVDALSVNWSKLVDEADLKDF